MASEEPAGRKANEGPRPERYKAPPGRAAQAARDVEFPLALRGYDRAAVDRYVEEVNRAIAELEISSSPASAVRHALEEVSEETAGLLQRAHETADEITARSRAQADDRLQRAQNEAQEVREAATREAAEIRSGVAREVEEMRAEAQDRVDRLKDNADGIAEERRRLLEEVNRIGERLIALARGEAAGPGDPEEATRELDRGGAEPEEPADGTGGSGSD